MARAKPEHPDGDEPKPRGNLPPLPPKKAARLEEEYRRMQAQQRKTTAESRQYDYANLWMQLAYPNRFVVWRDVWEGRGKKRTLVRTVLVQARKYEEMLDLLVQQGLLGAPDIHTWFVQDLDNPIAFV